jgi:hypothetical protein
LLWGAAFPLTFLLLLEVAVVAGMDQVEAGLGDIENLQTNH